MLLYIHIPFCQSKCPYCAFGSVVGKQNFAKDYFKALIADFKHQILSFSTPKNSISSVFIGGGTPSVIEAGLYENLFYEISDFLKKDAEITIEANPNSANLNWLKALRGFGVNRVSFGAQSFFEDKLKFLGRSHSAKEVYNAVENAKISGFSRINVDLIYGSKFDNKKRLLGEIENVKNLEISHLSAYSLTLEPKTPFEKKFEYQKDSVVLAKFLIKEIEKIGLKQYEISNFGEICRHNLGYWQGKNYLGIGAYAVGFVDQTRFYSPKDLSEYIKNPAQKQREILTHDDVIIERILLGLRSIVGVDFEILNTKQRQRAEILRKAKRLKFQNNRYYATNFLLADEISLFISG